MYIILGGGDAATVLDAPERGSDSGDVGREEVDAVAVEVAAGAVVVLGGAGVRVSGKDLGVPERDPASSAFVIAALSEGWCIGSGGSNARG
jgi:hypothetical protein